MCGGTGCRQPELQLSYGGLGPPGADLLLQAPLPRLQVELGVVLQLLGDLVPEAHDVALEVL